MTIAQTTCTSFKKEQYLAIHDFSTDVLKIALYTANASLGADTTVYTSTGEVAGTYTTDATAVADGILEAAVSVEPGYTLFRATTIGGRALGDITGEGTVTSADSFAYASWAAGTNTFAAQVAWIEGTLNPYMFANPVLYAAYLVATGVGTGYSTGGIPLTGVTVNTEGTTAYVDFANASWTGSLTARGGLIYNSSKGNKAICVLDFGADKTSTTTFLVTMPANTSTAALLRTA
jgi:hypothetical protein